MQTPKEKALQSLAENSIDVIVVGGGITGAGIALDAASRGLSVALFEKSDFASGTSSKSTKLIHGGLRYLKQLQFGVVRKTGLERSLLHQLAPHLVIPEKMLLPFYLGGTFNKYTTAAALFAYDTLAEVKREDSFKILGRRKTRLKEPLLKVKGLRGSGLYAEYRTDDARLTIEIIKTATRLGAYCFNYTPVSSIINTKGRATGVKVQLASGQSMEIKAKAIVNAAGPWVDKVRDMDGERGKKLIHSKGVHLVFDKEKLPLKHAVYFDKGDGRLLFAIPRNNSSYVGTTDTLYTGGLDDIPITNQDVDYILEGANSIFPDVSLSHGDIKSSWVGLRPLINEKGKKVTEISRRDEVFISRSGLITIAGGKLTGYRIMAQKVVDRICESYLNVKQNCITDSIAIGDHSEDVGGTSTIESFDFHQANCPKWYREYLHSNFGPAIEKILSNGDTYNDILRNEIRYCLNHEFVVCLQDYVERRSGKLYFHIDSLTSDQELILDEFANHFSWTKERKDKERIQLQDMISQKTTFI